MPIVQQGAINTTALIVPDLYVQIVPPQNLILNGVPTNRIGVVGTASWGPVGIATILGGMSDYARQFGPIIARKYDMGTSVATAVQQGASDFRAVRVTDGTDIAATVQIQTSCLLVTSLFTGSLANADTVTVSAGQQASTFKVTVARPGLQPEVFNNIGGTGNAFWVNVAAAIANGNNAIRGPSQLIKATAGAGTTAPTLASYTLGTTTPGSDGVSTITAATLIGVDTSTRTGMYALRSQGASLGVLADADDSTQWSVQAQFGAAEGVYMIATSPAGSAISNGTTGTVDVKATAGLDSYAVKLMHGDWIYWNDQTNGVLRLVSPQGFVAGRLANLSPEQSSLNKPLYGVVGTQKSGAPGSGQSQTYATAELTALFQAGIDVISNPQPGGAYWGVRLGHNSISDPTRNGDNYTRLINYISTTLNAGMGQYIGATINTDLFQRIRSTLLSFLQNMLSQKMLGTTNGKLPFGVVCDISNNPSSRTSLNYTQADIQVQFQGINEKFITNLEGGQSVTINSQTTPNGRV